jgi:hypothetical protein
MRPAPAPSDFDDFAIRLDERALPRRPTVRPARSLPWLRMGLVSAASIAALSYLAQGNAPQAPDPPLPARTPAALTAPAAAWHAIPSPAPFYALDAPALAGISSALQARRTARGAREDTLTVGSLADERAPHLRLVLLRTVGGEGSAPASLFVDLVRRAADAGVGVSRSGRAAALKTKLGPLEVAPVELAGEAPRACLGFRGQHADVGLRVAGWYCGPAAAPATPDSLACLVDALSLAPTAADPPLKVIFGQAERRQACGEVRIAQTPTRL